MPLGRFILRAGRAVVLNGDMDIPEMSFQRIPGVHRVRAGGMKHQVDRAYRLVHGMHKASRANFQSHRLLHPGARRQQLFLNRRGWRQDHRVRRTAALARQKERSMGAALLLVAEAVSARCAYAGLVALEPILGLAAQGV
jgi:hypothetical protein